MVNAYVRRLIYEHGLPEEARDRSWKKESMMEGEFQGMRIPKYDLPPRVNVELLEEMQDLMFEYGVIDRRVEIEAFIDESFVEAAKALL